MQNLIGHTPEDCFNYCRYRLGSKLLQYMEKKLLLARVVYLGIFLMPQIDYIGTCCWLARLYATDKLLRKLT